MEKRQLDFNAPLLSVRRISSPSNSSEIVKQKVIQKPLSRQQSLLVNKCNWESEEVTKPAAVPFHWEQIPGKPKVEVEVHGSIIEEPSNTPRLPPGRMSDASRQNSGETPRLPPGRTSGPSRYCSGERSNDQHSYRSQIESRSLNDHASLLEKLNESLDCKDESDSESGDEAYSDAFESISPTESWPLTYCVSGLSGRHSSGVKPSGTFTVDVQTRDFMMNRFLPAAKALVLEKQKLAVKKPSVLNEQPKQVKKVVSAEMKPLVKQHCSDALPCNSQSMDNVESEDEDQESFPVKKMGKAFRILPRFCVKNALCLFNPLPAMKSRASSPTPSTGEARKFTRNSHSGPLDKSAFQLPNKIKFHSGLLSRDLPKIDNKVTVDSSQSQKLSPLRRYRSGNISPHQSESPKSPFRGVGSLVVPKEVENYNANKIASSRKLFKALQDVSRNQMNERGSGLLCDVMEKTLCTDFAKKTGSPISVSSGTKAERHVKDNLIRTLHVVKSDQDLSSLRILEERKRPSTKSVSPDQIPPSAWKSKFGYLADRTVDTKMNECLGQESKSLGGTKDVQEDFSGNPLASHVVEKNPESDKQRDSDPTLKSHLPPPLPKSPSESWLWRTISTGKPIYQSHLRSPTHRKKHGPNGSTTDAKWETIVKTSGQRHDHVCYSEVAPHDLLNFPL